MADEQPVKSGFKTSEFWLAVAASVIGILLDSGLIHNAAANSGIGLIASALASMGYSWSRAQVKK